MAHLREGGEGGGQVIREEVRDVEAERRVEGDDGVRYRPRDFSKTENRLGDIVMKTFFGFKNVGTAITLQLPVGRKLSKNIKYQISKILGSAIVRGSNWFSVWDPVARSTSGTRHSMLKHYTR